MPSEFPAWLPAISTRMVAEPTELSVCQRPSWPSARQALPAEGRHAEHVSEHGLEAGLTDRGIVEGTGGARHLRQTDCGTQALAPRARSSIHDSSSLPSETESFSEQQSEAANCREAVTEM